MPNNLDAVLKLENSLTLLPSSTVSLQPITVEVAGRVVVSFCSPNSVTFRAATRCRITAATSLARSYRDELLSRIVLLPPEIQEQIAEWTMLQNSSVDLFPRRELCGLITGNPLDSPLVTHLATVPGFAQLAYKAFFNVNLFVLHPQLEMDPYGMIRSRIRTPNVGIVPKVRYYGINMTINRTAWSALRRFIATGQLQDIEFCELCVDWGCYGDIDGVMVSDIPTSTELRLQAAETAFQEFCSRVIGTGPSPHGHHMVRFPGAGCLSFAGRISFAEKGLDTESSTVPSDAFQRRCEQKLRGYVAFNCEKAERETTQGNKET